MIISNVLTLTLLIWLLACQICLAVGVLNGTEILLLNNIAILPFSAIIEQQRNTLCKIGFNKNGFDTQTQFTLHDISKSKYLIVPPAISII